MHRWETYIESYGGHTPYGSKDAMAEETTSWGHPPLNGVQCVYIRTVRVGVLPVCCLHHGLPRMTVDVPGKYLDSY